MPMTSQLPGQPVEYDPLQPPPSYDEVMHPRHDRSPQQQQQQQTYYPPAAPYYATLPASEPPTADFLPTELDVPSGFNTPNAPVLGVHSASSWDASRRSPEARRHSSNIETRSQPVVETEAVDCDLSFDTLACLACCVCFCSPIFGTIALLFAVKGKSMDQSTPRNVKLARKVGRRSICFSITGICFTVASVLLVVRNWNQPVTFHWSKPPTTTARSIWRYETLGYSLYTRPTKRPCYGYELNGICYRLREDCAPRNCCESGEVQHEDKCYFNSPYLKYSECFAFSTPCQPIVACNNDAFYENKCYIGSTAEFGSIAATWCSGGPIKASEMRFSWLTACYSEKSPVLDTATCCNSSELLYAGGYCYKTVDAGFCSNECYTVNGICYNSKRDFRPGCYDQSTECCRRSNGTYYNYHCYLNAY